MPGIYKITSPTGKVYIGQTSMDFTKRFSYYKSLRCKRQPKLFASIVKYGYDAHGFEIVEELKSNIQLELIDAFEEAVYYEYVESGYEMLNTRIPGLQPKHSKETIEKIRRSLTGKIRSKESVRKANETKIKNGTTGKGIPKPDSVKEKIRQKLLGRKIPIGVIEKREATMSLLQHRQNRKGIKFKK